MGQIIVAAWKAVGIDVTVELEQLPRQKSETGWRYAVRIVNLPGGLPPKHPALMQAAE